MVSCLCLRLIDRLCVLLYCILVKAPDHSEAISGIRSAPIEGVRLIYHAGLLILYTFSGYTALASPMVETEAIACDQLDRPVKEAMARSQQIMQCSSQLLLIVQSILFWIQHCVETQPQRWCCSRDSCTFNENGNPRHRAQYSTEQYTCTFARTKTLVLSSNRKSFADKIQVVYHCLRLGVD
jgi:hypothetical protein